MTQHSKPAAQIIYFDIDSLRTDHPGCYGYDRPTASNLGRLAQRDTGFDHYV